MLVQAIWYLFNIGLSTQICENDKESLAICTEHVHANALYSIMSLGQNHIKKPSENAIYVWMNGRGKKLHFWKYPNTCGWGLKKRSPWLLERGNGWTQGASVVSNNFLEAHKPANRLCYLSLSFQLQAQALQV